MTALPNDPTLDEIRTALSPLLGAHAAFDGWNARAVIAAAQDMGIDGDVAMLAFAGGGISGGIIGGRGGAMDLIDAWTDSIDAEMARRLAPEMLDAMKIRARITALIETRLDIMLPGKEALRRAMAIMAMPGNLRRAAGLGWRSADRMWRLAGDRASDFNHYTKRITLSAVYGSTLAVFIDDDSENFAETQGFLARRIENVMQFEKFKAQANARREFRPSLARFAGRLRYPAR